MQDLVKPYILYQYKNDTKLNELLTDIFDGFKSVCMDNLQEFLDIDKASGIWLDRIGLYLNFERPFVYESSFAYDSFPSGYDDALFGYDDEGESLNDDLYKIFLKAEIIRRNSNMTDESLRLLIKFATDAYKVKIDSGVKNVGISAFFDNQEKGEFASMMSFLFSNWIGLPTAVMLLAFNVAYPQIIDTNNAPLKITGLNNDVFIAYNDLTYSSAKLNMYNNFTSKTTGTSGYGREIITDGTYIYFLNSIGTLYKINPATNVVVSSVSVGGSDPGAISQSMTYGDGFIWVAMRNASNVYKVNVSSMAVSAIIPISNSLGLKSKIIYYKDVSDRECIWLTGSSKIIQINVDTNLEVYDIGLVANELAIVYDTEAEDYYVWASVSNMKRIYILDFFDVLLQVDITEAQWKTPTNINKIITHNGFVWFNDSTNKKIYKMFIGQSALTIYADHVIDLDESADDFFIQDDYLYLTNSGSDTITKLNIKGELE